MTIEYLLGVRPYGVGAAPAILACLVVFPAALVLAATYWPRGRGPTWGELLGPIGDLHRPAWAAPHYHFGWPVRRNVDRVYGLLVTKANEVVLIEHDRHDRQP